MPTLLSSRKTRPVRKSPPATYLMLVLLVAAGVGVIARYHSGQKYVTGTQPWETPAAGTARIISGPPLQGPFELRVGAAISAPMGYWPGIFLTVHYAGGNKMSTLALLHRELVNSFLPGPSSAMQPRGGDVVSRFITATVQPYTQNLVPCGDRTPISFNPVFGPEAPLAGALPTTYSARTSQLVIDVYENSNHANHGRWIIGNIPCSMELVPDHARTVSSLQLGNVHLEGKALELPDTQQPIISGRAENSIGSPFSPFAYSSDFHYVTGLPALECLLRATAKSARPGEWRIIVDRMLPEWMAQTPRMRGMAGPPSVTNVTRTYTLQVGRNSTVDNSFLMYCCPTYSHQQKLMLVGGHVVRQTLGDKIITIHDADLIYNAKTHTYEAQWSRYEPQTASGVMLFPVNVRRDARRQQASHELDDTAEFRVAYRYNVAEHDGHTVRPENLPEAALVDPFNRNPDGTPALIRIPPPFYNEVPHLGTPFDDWFDMYLPGRLPPKSEQRAQDFAPGVHALVHNHCGGILFRVRLPRAIAPHHRTIHLGEIKFVVSSRSVTATYPFTLILPVTAGSNRDRDNLMSTASATAPSPSDLASLFPPR